MIYRCVSLVSTRKVSQIYNCKLVAPRIKVGVGVGEDLALLLIEKEIEKKKNKLRQLLAIKMYSKIKKINHNYQMTSYGQKRYLC